MGWGESVPKRPGNFLPRNDIVVAGSDLCGVGRLGFVVMVMVKGAERRGVILYYWLESSRFDQMLGSKAAFAKAPGARCADLFRRQCLAACFAPK